MPKVGKTSAALRARIKQIFESDPEINATECAKRLKASGEKLGVTTLRGKAGPILKALRAARTEEEEEQTGDLHDAGAPTADRFDYGHDGYVFTLRGEDEFNLPRVVVADLCWLYSTQGGKRTARQTCLELYERHHITLTEDYAVRLVRLLGIRKTSPPFPPHLLQKHDAEELDKLNLARLQAESEFVLRKNEVKNLRQLWKDAVVKLASRDRLVDAMVDAIENHAPRKVKKIKAGPSKVLPVCCLYDVHCHKVDVNGEDHSIESLMDAAHAMARKLAIFGRHERIVVAFGGDFFHVDTRWKTTTAGTPQDMHLTAAQAMWSGIDAAIEYVEIMRRVCDVVDVVIVNGNHDELTTWSLAKSLSLYFCKSPDVNVPLRELSRTYMEYGKVLIGFEHGDGPKPVDLASIMQTEQREAWGRTLWGFWITGHLHHEKVIDRNGVTILQSRSLAGADKWHHKNGYVTSTPGHDCHLFCEHTGRFASLYV